MGPRKAPEKTKNMCTSKMGILWYPQLQTPKLNSGYSLDGGETLSEDTERGTLKIKPASAHLHLFSLLAAGGEMTAYPSRPEGTTSCFTLCFVSHKVMFQPP